MTDVEYKWNIEGIQHHATEAGDMKPPGFFRWLLQRGQHLILGAFACFFIAATMSTLNVFMDADELGTGAITWVVLGNVLFGIDVVKQVRMMHLHFDMMQEQTMLARGGMTFEDTLPSDPPPPEFFDALDNKVETGELPREVAEILKRKIRDHYEGKNEEPHVGQYL